MAPKNRTSGRNPDAEKLRRQAHRRAVGQSGRPQRHDRVAVEQRHAAVVDVVAVMAELLGRRVRDPGQAALAALDGLGRSGRSRREEQQEQRLLVDAGARPSGRPGVRRRGRGTRGRRRAGTGTASRPWSRSRSRLMPGVSVTISWQSACRMSAARPSEPRVGFSPTIGGTGQCGAAEPEHEVRHVVEQHADVKRCRAEVLVAQRTRQGRPGRRFTDHLVPGPVAVHGSAAPGAGRRPDPAASRRCRSSLSRDPVDRDRRSRCPPRTAGV